MTDYTALADRCTEAGIGEKSYSMNLYRVPKSNSWQQSEHFCHDWRVVGAAMEKCNEINVVILGGGTKASAMVVVGGLADTETCHESTAIAILTACLDALEGRVIDGNASN